MNKKIKINKNPPSNYPIQIIENGKLTGFMPPVIKDETDKLVVKPKWTSNPNLTKQASTFSNAKKTKNKTNHITSVVYTSFDFTKKILYINNKSVKTRGYKLELLEFLMKNDRNKRKKWFMDMLFDKFQDEIDRQHSNENDFARKIYIACDGLKKSISIQAGINDFLIYNLSSVQINPQYI